ncbi:hypothetical protein GYA19_02615 [Candidatus Beckwithbacteria bacterium]|nr:hypothetical protein [Candidatus Beckwithbacteria bacterium]
MNSQIKTAIIPIAGKCSRFYPFQGEGNKANFLIMGKPVIAHTIEALIKTGITSIHIVKSPLDQQIESNLAIYQDKINIIFHNQDTAKGTADAILQVKGLTDRFLLINQQQINIDEQIGILEKFLQQNNLNNQDLVVFSQTVDNPSKYGMLGLDGIKVTKVVEKPVNLDGLSNQAIRGIYLLNSEFLDTMAKMPPEEYLLEKCLDLYAEQHKLFACETNIKSPTLKFVWDIFTISEKLFERYNKEPQINPNTFIHKTTIIEGPVVIEEGASIYEYALIKGPVYLGKNALVGSYCKVRKGSILEEGAQVQSYGEISHSYIGKNTHIHSGFVGDSIIGTNSRIGANFITGNRRLDRNNVKCLVKNELRDTGSSYLGCIMGENSKIGIHCGTNPGVIIPAQTKILPGTIVTKDTKYE